MKRLYVALPVFALVLIGGCQKNAGDIINDVYPEKQKAVENLIRVEIFEAAKAKDFARLEKLHLVGPKFTKFDDWEPLARQDAQTAIKAERDAFGAVSDFNYDIQDLKVDVFGDVAVATFVVDYSMKAGDDPLAARARSTMVFVNDAGSWKITHEHFSPFKSNP